MRSSAFAIAVVAVLSACEKKTDSPAPPPAAPKEQPPAKPAGQDDPILLGEVGSLTGSEAAFGISTRNGIELAIDEANAAGGVKGRKLR